MIKISITEFRNNIKYYSQKVVEDDILVINKGKPVMRVINPYKPKIESVESIMGCVPYHDEDLDKIMEDKLKEL